MNTVSSFLFVLIAVYTKVTENLMFNNNNKKIDFIFTIKQDSFAWFRFFFKLI